MKGIDVEAPASERLINVASFAILLVTVAVLIWVVKWW